MDGVKILLPTWLGVDDGDDGDAGLLEERGGLAPHGGILAQGIERELHAAEADGAEVFDELLRAGGLKRPTANGETIFERRGHGSLGLTSRDGASRL